MISISLFWFGLNLILISQVYIFFKFLSVFEVTLIMIVDILLININIENWTREEGEWRDTKNN